MYSYRVLGQPDTHRRAKGIQKTVVRQRLRHEDYLKQLHNPERTTLTNCRIQSDKHNLFTITQAKSGLCCFDNKRFLMEDGVNTLAIGHYKLKGEVLDAEAESLTEELDEPERDLIEEEADADVARLFQEMEDDRKAGRNPYHSTFDYGPIETEEEAEARYAVMFAESVVRHPIPPEHTCQQQEQQLVEEQEMSLLDSTQNTKPQEDEPGKWKIWPTEADIEAGKLRDFQQPSDDVLRDLFGDILGPHFFDREEPI